MTYYGNTAGRRYASSGRSRTVVREIRRPLFHVIHPPEPNTSPLRDVESLGRKIISENDTYLEPLPDKADDFLAGGIRTSTEQVRLLMEQLKARHAISDRIQEGLLHTERELEIELDTAREWKPADETADRKIAGLQRQLGDIARQRDMEDVALWRDSQRLLTDLFRHWHELDDHTRRKSVLDDDDI